MNSRGGVFCELHQNQFGTRCHVQDCTNFKVAKTKACLIHQDLWTKHVQKHTRQTFPGARRVFQQPNTQPWLQTNQTTQPAHDEPVEEELQWKTYFSPSRFYCVETICAPCGVVIAWAKFPKSESPTNILAFLESVFPTEESRPDYICIDKACAVLRTAIVNGSWDRIWKKSTCFIVDSYHYINHRTTDHLCRKWCNPAPLDGSEPNTVIVDKDKDGNNYYKCAFNTQVNLNRLLFFLSF